MERLKTMLTPLQFQATRSTSTRSAVAAKATNVGRKKSSRRAILDDDDDDDSSFASFDTPPPPSPDNDDDDLDEVESIEVISKKKKDGPKKRATNKKKDSPPVSSESVLVVATSPSPAIPPAVTPGKTNVSTPFSPAAGTTDSLAQSSSATKSKVSTITPNAANKESAKKTTKPKGKRLTAQEKVFQHHTASAEGEAQLAEELYEVKQEVIKQLERDLKYEQDVIKRKLEDIKRSEDRAKQMTERLEKMKQELAKSSTIKRAKKRVPKEAEKLQLKATEDLSKKDQIILELKKEKASAAKIIKKHVAMAEESETKQSRPKTKVIDKKRKKNDDDWKSSGEEEESESEDESDYEDTFSKKRKIKQDDTGVEAKSTPQRSSSRRASAKQSWSCHHCTLENNPTDEECMACGQYKGTFPEKDKK